MKQLTINLPSRTHPVSIGSQILALPEVWPRPSGQNQQAMVYLDQAVANFLPQLQAGLEAAGWQVHSRLLDGGESLKDFESIYPLYAELMQAGIQRRSLLVAVGGGTVGDAIGFLAATYLRGIDWINVPTTLLAQVDSCLGGKTGVNHAAGKNLIGAIYQPVAIVCELDFLKGLGQRDRVSGLGEMLKYGLIEDPAFWEQLVAQAPAIIAGESAALEAAVARSLQIKAQFVAGDELDLTGVRAILNFGHTFGHALEAATQYGYYRHGEAVLLGMQMALQMSALMGLLPDERATELMTPLQQLPCPPVPEGISAEDLLEPMLHDKKNDGRGIRCLLLPDIGRIQQVEVPLSEMRERLPQVLAALQTSETDA